MEMHFIMCLSKPRLSYNGKGLAGAGKQGSPQPPVVLGSISTHLLAGMPEW